MRGLTIIVATPDPARFHAALSIAAAAAATGAAVRLYLHADAVALATPGAVHPDATRFTAAGLPTLDQLRADALAMGVRIIACQTGLAMCATDAATLPQGIEAGGLVSLIASLGDDRLVTL